jgi:uncharacterized protein (TIGR00251 family)
MKPALPITLRVKVTARSASSEIVGELVDGTLKVKIAAPPERGKANQALIALLAEHYRVPRTSVTIVSGHTASLKLVKIALGRS